MWCAITSLPAPDSPVTKTLVSVAATRSQRVKVAMLCGSTAITLCSAVRICEPTSLALGAASIDAVALLEFVCGTSGGW